MQTLRYLMLATALVAAAACNKSKSSTITGPSAVNAGALVVNNLRIDQRIDLSVGDSRQLTAIVRTSDGFEKDVTGIATWISESPDVASVGSGGMLRANKPGGAAVTVSWQTYTSRVAVNVADV